jgi:aprataxin
MIFQSFPRNASRPINLNPKTHVRGFWGLELINTVQKLMNSTRNVATTASVASKKPNAWNEGLLTYVNNPKHTDIVYSNDDVVVIKDKYPKAKFHFLVMPKKRMELKDLKLADLPTLQSMKDVADEVVKTEKVVGRVKMGFHAVPSMAQLHMHIISQDFVSDSLKNKKHWNSFTTDFFKEYDSLVEHLKKKGVIDYDLHYHEQLLKGDLHPCHCGAKLKNFPNLKQHLLTHQPSR